MDDTMHKRVQRLMKFIEADSMKEVIRRALIHYEKAVAKEGK
jgi:hypothetical protein